jgi:KDO2-lipid IV(A) lauroyltransferase
MARHDVPDLRDRIEYALFAGLLAVLRASSVAGSRRRGRWVGRFVDGIVPLRRRVALDNLGRAFPDRDERWCRDVYRGMCETMGMTLAEFARFQSPGPLADMITIENAGAVAAALEGGRGAILLGAHLGNWEVMGAGLAEMGYPVTVLGARQRNPLVEDAFDRLRGQRSVRSITVGKSLRPIVEALRAGRCVATLADQDGGSEGFFLDFLGRPASVQPGIFRLAARSGVPLVTGFAVRDGAGQRGEMQDPLWPEAARAPEAVEAEARRLAGIYTERVAAAVRRHPDHWLWVHRRWRTRPPQEAAGPSRET